MNGGIIFVDIDVKVFCTNQCLLRLFESKNHFNEDVMVAPFLIFSIKQPHDYRK